MVAPYFQWAASFDLDEFLAAIAGVNNEGITTKGHAEDVLNSVDSATYPPFAGY